MKKLLLILVIIVSYLYLIGIFSKMFLADMYFKSSKNLLEEGQIIAATEHIVKATRYNSSEPAYKRQKAKVLLSTMVWQLDEEIKQKTLEELQAAEKLNPKNLATLRNVIPLYYLLSTGNVEETAGTKNLDENYLNQTRTYFQKLKNTYTNDLGIYTDIAKYEKKLGLTQEYNQTYKQAQQMRPDIVEWHESFK